MSGVLPARQWLSSRSRLHWTPKYVVDRLSVAYMEARHPEWPWLSTTVVPQLDSLLHSTDVGLEVGSGRSTTWFAERTRQLTSIEHDPEWVYKLENSVSNRGLGNVTIQYIPYRSDVLDHASEYRAFIENLPDTSLDYALIDGFHRSVTSNAVLRKLKEGGLLIIDDVHRYLPSASRTPGARSAKDGPLDGEWGLFWERTMAMRRLWFSDGVHDTAIFITMAVGSTDA